MDDFFVADTKTNAPSRHIVALRQGEKLHADILRARHLEKARRLVAVESQIGISKIVNDEEAMFLGGLDDPLEKSDVDHFSGRIMREADDQHFRLRPSLANRLFEVAEKRLAGRERYAAQIAAGEHHGKLVNRISRAGTEHHIAGVDGCPGQMRYALFGADGDDRLTVGIEIDIVTAFVPSNDRQAQFVNAAGDRVTVVLRLACGLNELG